MWKSKFTLSVMMALILAVGARAGCCKLSCDPSLEIAYNYQDGEIEKAYQKLISNTKEMIQASLENSKSIQKHNLVLASLLEREKIAYSIQREKSFQANKMALLFSKLFDLNQVKTELETSLEE